MTPRELDQMVEQYVTAYVFPIGAGLFIAALIVFFLTPLIDYCVRWWWPSK